MSITKTYVLSLCLLLAAGASAYELFEQEGYGETVLGDPINQLGTRRTESSAPVEFRVNLLRVDDYDLDGQPDSSSTLPTADRERLARLINSACQYWSSVPSSSIDLQLSGSFETSTYLNLNSFIGVTLGGTPSNVGGASWGGSSQGQTLSYGIIINIDYFRAVSDDTILPTIVHEIGHALSLSHSSCDRNLCNNERFSFTDSEGAFMSYGDAGGRALLHTDDIAGIGHAYPNASTETDFGSVVGELVDENDQPIFGGNVFAVDASNRAVVARISGLTDFDSLASTHGRFRITGLAPGTYTIVGASITDSTFRIGSVPRLPFDSSYRTDFSPAIRTQVVVRAGEDTDLGRLVAGSDTEEAPEGTRYEWSPVAGAEYYLVYLYSFAEGRWIISARQVAENAVALELEEGRYYLFVYARTANGWVRAEARVLRSGERPPVIEAPAVVSATAPARVMIRFAASDPLGGRIGLSATGMPEGMSLYDGLLNWPVSSAGEYAITIVATNEVGESVSHDLLLSVEAPSTHRVTIEWDALPEDNAYWMGLYSYGEGTWLDRSYVAESSVTRDLSTGQYLVYAYARTLRSFRWGGQTYQFPVWRFLGYQVFQVDGEMRVGLQ